MRARHDRLLGGLQLDDVLPDGGHRGSHCVRQGRHEPARVGRAGGSEAAQGGGRHLSDRTVRVQ